MIENCRECGLKYFPEYSPTPSPDVTFIPHQHPPPPYTETVPPTMMPSAIISNITTMIRVLFSSYPN
jgi:hypothetical protein